MAKKFLYVFPNPYLHIDHDGFPNGACPTDRLEHVGPATRSWVGASLDPKGTFHLEVLSKEEEQYRHPTQQTRFKFDLVKPTMLPVTEYYKDRLRCGEIFPASKATADLAGVPFVEPKAALAASKAAALVEWQRHYGKEATPEFLNAHDVSITETATAPSVSGPQGGSK